MIYRLIIGGTIIEPEVVGLPKVVVIHPEYVAILVALLLLLTILVIVKHLLLIECVVHLLILVEIWLHVVIKLLLLRINVLEGAECNTVIIVLVTQII